MNLNSRKQRGKSSKDGHNEGEEANQLYGRTAHGVLQRFHFQCVCSLLYSAERHFAACSTILFQACPLLLRQMRTKNSIRYNKKIKF